MKYIHSSLFASAVGVVLPLLLAVAAVGNYLCMRCAAQVVPMSMLVYSFISCISSIVESRLDMHVRVCITRDPMIPSINTHPCTYFIHFWLLHKLTLDIHMRIHCYPFIPFRYYILPHYIVPSNERTISYLFYFYIIIIDIWACALCALGRSATETEPVFLCGWLWNGINTDCCGF